MCYLTGLGHTTLLLQHLVPEDSFGDARPMHCALSLCGRPPCILLTEWLTKGEFSGSVDESSFGWRLHQTPSSAVAASSMLEGSAVFLALPQLLLTVPGRLGWWGRRVARRGVNGEA